MPLDQGHHDLSQEPSSGHPLEVVAPSMEIGPVQLASRENPFEPAERFFMPDVHAERDLRLPTVATKVPFTDEETDDVALVKKRELGGKFHGKHDGETVIADGGRSQAAGAAPG